MTVHKHLPAPQGALPYGDSGIVGAHCYPFGAQICIPADVLFQPSTRTLASRLTRCRRSGPMPGGLFHLFR